MLVLPLTEILFFIAVFFAPPEATAIQIESGSGGGIVFVRTDDGWRPTAGEGLWSKDGRTVMHDDQEYDVSRYVSGIDEEWPEGEILTIGGSAQLKRVGDDIHVYPNGLERPDDRIAISYVVEDNAEGQE